MNAQASPLEVASREDAVLEHRQAPEMPVVKSFASFDDLPPTYERLFDDAQTASFFHGLPWYRNLSTALANDEQIRILALESQDAAHTPLAILPLRHAREHRSAWQPRTLSALSNYYTTVYAPLLDPSFNIDDALAPLARAIRTESPSWDVVNFKPLERDSPIFAAIVQVFRSAGMVVQTYFCHGNWYYPVNGRSYGEYLESLKSSVRNIARSKNKKLERTGRARFELTTGFDGLDKAIQAYEKIYAASWKVPEPFPLFVPGLIRACARMGWLRLGVAYVDGEPAATQLWIVNNGVASIYKIAYDQKFKDLSVGSFLTMRLMEHAIDVDRVREIDYLSGDDRYKSDWMSHRREHWGILAMNPRTIRGALAIVRHVGGRAAKRALQRLSGIIPKSSPKPASK
jgi:CelD/BcsL family acetyltransferase involved in cellulose biosynthesis